jgi:hypothetical protein
MIGGFHLPPEHPMRKQHDLTATFRNLAAAVSPIERHGAHSKAIYRKTEESCPFSIPSLNFDILFLLN